MQQNNINLRYNNTKLNRPTHKLLIITKKSIFIIYLTEFLIDLRCNGCILALYRCTWFGVLGYVLLYLGAGPHHAYLGGHEGTVLRQGHRDLAGGLGVPPPLVQSPVPRRFLGGRDVHVGFNGDLASDDGAPVRQGEQSRAGPPQSGFGGRLQEGAVV